MLTVQDFVNWIEKANENIQANQAYLTSLDQAIGDGDHGINMSRGFQETAEKVREKNYTTGAEVLQDTAKTLMSKVGGASGPLFGTAFLKLSTAVKGVEPVDYGTFLEALMDAVNGIKQRGKAAEGDKTLVDVWSEMADMFSRESDFNADKITTEAKCAMEETKNMMAAKGRAAYFKEGSIGYIDPGAASSFYIFKALSETVEGGP